MKNKFLQNIIASILTIILLLFMWHKFLLSGNSVILVMFIPILYYFLKRTLEKENKRKFVISLIISIIFTTIEIICTSINYDYTLNHIIDKWLLLNILGYTIIFWSVISTIYTFLEEHKFKIKKLKFLDTRWLFFINVILILLAWIPYFLRYYPGLLTADSCTQVAQALGIVELSNHHPILHTGIISLFINLGNSIFKDINIAVAMYTIFQMIVMASMFSYVLVYIKKKNAPIIAIIIALLYYMFYPINALFGITMWKDVLFAGIIPIYVILTFELLNNTTQFLEKIKNVIIYVIISLLVMFLRNNGLYIVVLILPFVIIALRKYWRKVLTISLIILISYFSLKTIIFNSLKIKNGSVGEMLSIPLQQIARTKKYNKQELSEDTIQKIDKFFNCENIEDKYNPILSDPVKAQLNTDYFDENKGEFISLWLELLKNYFKDYTESFISNSYGYYYPEAKHWVANRTMEKNSMGIEQQPIIEGSIVSKVDSLIERRDIPIVSMFFSIGMAFWIIVVSVGYEILRKHYKNILIYIIIFILWLTIVASPVFCEYRYAYPMFTILPLYLSLNLIKEEAESKGK